MSWELDIDMINLDVLGAIRQRLGAEDENDNSQDEKIKHMTPKKCVGAYSGWILGDEEIAITFINLYEQLIETVKEEDV